MVVFVTGFSMWKGKEKSEWNGISIDLHFFARPNGFPFPLLVHACDQVNASLPLPVSQSVQNDQVNDISDSGGSHSMSIRDHSNLRKQQHETMFGEI